MDPSADAVVRSFRENGFGYDDIGIDQLKKLLACCDIELAKCRLDPDTPLQASMRMSGKIDCETNRYGGIKHAALYVDGHYFEMREAVSFDGDGTIRLAGWADSKNIVPFSIAFAKWVEMIALERQICHG